MSGIAGLFNRDRQPAAAEILQRMTRVASHRGPDAIASWSEGSVGLSQLLMATTPEAVGELRPLQDAGTGACIVFDGRVDNRKELLAALGRGAGAGHDVTDLELVLRAYLRWDAACVARILGDFAFAIWDFRNRRMLCARDIAAVRPFHYFVSDRAFAFGSEVCQVLQHPLVSREPNEGMIGETLACALVNREETVYRDVYRLPAAHCLLIDETRLDIRRFWDIDPGKRLRYRDDGEYQSHFEEIFREAVSCRLRCGGGVGATLSGGLDSPSVAGMAQSIFAGGDGRRILESFSLVYPGRDCDESALIDDSVRKWGLIAHRHAFSRFDEAPEWSRQVRESLCPPEYPTLTALGFLHRMARSRGIRVLLSGAGAATWLGGSEYPYRGLLRERKIGRLLGEARYQAAAWGARHALSRVGGSLLWPAVPRPLKRKLEASRKRAFPSHFLREDFARAIDLDARAHRYDSAERFSDLAQWSACRHGFSGAGAFYRESEDATNARNAIEERHPFWDRRLIEFALAIPDFVHHDKDRQKLLLRSSGERLLPDTVRTHPAQTEVGCVFVEAMKHETVRTAFRSLRIAERGWVAAERVRKVYDRLYGCYEKGSPIPVDDYRLLMPLWMVFAIECWQREAGPDLARGFPPV